MQLIMSAKHKLKTWKPKTPVLHINSAADKRIAFLITLKDLFLLIW